MQFLVDTGKAVLSVTHIRGISPIVKEDEATYAIGVALEGYLSQGQSVLQLRYSDTVTAQEVYELLVTSWEDYLQMTEGPEMVSGPDIDPGIQTLFDRILTGNVAGEVDDESEEDDGKDSVPCACGEDICPGCKD